MKLHLYFAATLTAALAVAHPGKSVAAEVTELTIIDARPAGSQPKLCCLSGADTSPGGGLLIVSDGGTLFEAELDQTQASLKITKSTRLTLSDGAPLPGHREDAEGVAITPDGEVFISFEGEHRVARYQDARGVSSIKAPAGVRLARNGGLEALAVDEWANFWTIPETVSEGGFPILKLSGTTWTTQGQLPAEGGFLPVGADFAGVGALYVLERKFSYLRFQSRVRRVTLSGGEIKGDEEVWRSGPGQFDNLEAIVALEDHDGAAQLLLISDDNENPFQETQAILLTLQD